ncbi:MAG TPA: DoxX family protein [Planctomycetota bacterium]|nr:DoxX family protein [Planctomycetota bacterium]
MLGLFKVPPLSTRASAALLLLRVVAGVAFMHHGWGKIQNPTGWMGESSGIPGFFQALAAISEFGGGLAWIIGLLTPLASFGLACTMAVAVHFHAVIRGDPFVAKGPGASYEPAALFFCIAILFILAGPGRFSLDRLIFGEQIKKEG